MKRSTVVRDVKRQLIYDCGYHLVHYLQYGWMVSQLMQSLL